MNATKRTGGFYATDEEVFYITPSGRSWIVASPDGGPDPEEIKVSDIPEDATEVDNSLTGDEQAEYMRAVEVVS